LRGAFQAGGYTLVFGFGFFADAFEQFGGDPAAGGLAFDIFSAARWFRT